MPCTFSTPLSDDEISVALDGEAAETIHEHLAACSFCAARLDKARKVEQMLIERLFRWECPTSQRLGDYHAGFISNDEAGTITEHVQGCARCQEELQDLRLFLEAEPSLPVKPVVPSRKPKPLGSRLGEFVAQLMPQQLAPAMRGDDSGPRIAETDGLTIFLEVQAGERGRALVGQLAAEKPELWTTALVELRQAGVLQATAELDDLGSFRCEPLVEGFISIRITSPRGQIIVLEI